MKNGCCIKSLIMEIMRNPKPLARQNTGLLIPESEVYLGPCQISMMELFSTIKAPSLMFGKILNTPPATGPRLIAQLLHINPF